jgi:UDP-N-acetylmuramoyl-L-alanyl-D-glutamate--2,6-diaminopimelate ligase
VELRADANIGVCLRALLDDAEIVGAGDVRVQHCTTEAGSCRTGDVFIACSDEGSDGHEAAAEAVRLGAVAVIASRPVQVPVPVCYVPDTRLAYGRICQALAGHPSTQLKTIGIAGSLGKTTTGYLIASILSAAGRTPGVLGSLGYCDGEEIADARWTTPPPPVGAAWLARMVENGCTHAVLEASPRGIDRRHTAGIVYDACCVTNLHRDAVRGDRHGDPRRLVARLLEQLSPEGVLVANVDDPGASAVVAEHEGPVITVGLHEPAEITATFVERHLSEQTFLLSFDREVVPVRSHLVGPHNVANCLVAAAVGTVYGITPDVIVRGLESVRELPGRLERIECGQPFGVFLDDAPSPAALAACLETLRTTTQRRLLCVLDETTTAGSALDDWHRVIRSWCDEAVVLDGHGGDQAAEIRRRSRRADAVARTLRNASAGDCVLIAGNGGFGVQEDRDAWDDRQIVRHTLYRMLHDAPRMHTA